MEHLLLPHGAILEKSDQAQYKAEKYDGGPFLNYPQRSRFRSLHEFLFPPEGKVYLEPLHEDYKSHMEIFLQTWLIFVSSARNSGRRLKRGRIRTNPEER